MKKTRLQFIAGQIKAITCLQDIIVFLPGLIIAALTTAFASTIALNHDAGTYLMFAGKLLEGKTFYNDLIDTNTPLISYLSIIPVMLSNITGISVPDSFLIFLFIILNGSIILSWQIAKIHPLFENKLSGAALLTSLYYLLFITPILDFGQREHLFFAFVLPFVFLVLNHLNKIESSKAIQIAAGVLGAIGFSLKPHFIAIFIASELFLLIYKKDFFFWVRRESLIISGFFALYHLAIIILSPNYIFELAPYFSFNYEAYGNDWLTVIKEFQNWLLLIVVVFLFSAKSAPQKIIALLFCLALTGILIFAAHKNIYFYHKYPFIFFSLLLMAYVIILHEKSWAIFFLLPLLFIYSYNSDPRLNYKVMQDYKKYVLEFAEKIDSMAKGEKLVFINTSVTDAFPVINYSQAAWGLSFSFLQHIPSNYLKYSNNGNKPVPYNTPVMMQGSEKYFHARVIYDLQQMPKLIIVNFGWKQGFYGSHFDFLEYFMNDPRFVKLMKNYSYSETFGTYNIYKRK